MTDKIPERLSAKMDENEFFAVMVGIIALLGLVSAAVVLYAAVVLTRGLLLVVLFWLAVGWVVKVALTPTQEERK